MNDIHVLLMGEPSLLERSVEVVEFDDSLKSLIDKMKEAMKQKGGVGIAAPQIGYNQRVIIYELNHNERYPDKAPIPFTVLVNPVYQPVDENNQVEGWEGCLSVPGLRAKISRYQSIQCSGYDVDGNKIERIISDFEARIIQHEVDHLDGVLFPHRVKNVADFGYEQVLWPKIFGVPYPKKSVS